ncbi:hypothetical protein [Nocardia bhagyanarayanae]|uniref:Uncharacterized protein n=1 Tax=Nocardia bhagyanarayanae TaxID=1215925 RepID=A0A543FDQ1_9NOCA|nr:hypothetical protein [Nocardia bhagyanarayanae]TQM32025.1 hypothetical protein FB390_3695 [Nocardia bhagyanarayanae]
MILATALDVLAQVGNPAPEPPPESGKSLQLVRYLIWFAIIGVVAVVVIGIPLIVVLVTRRSNRRAPGGPGPGYGGAHPPGPGGPGGGGPAGSGNHGYGGGGPRV